MIARDRQIAENPASDRQQLYGNTFQRSGDYGHGHGHGPRGGLFNSSTRRGGLAC